MRTLHIGLRVADLERSLAFYTGLGYEVLGSVPETAFGSLTMLKLPRDEFVTIELVHDPGRGEVGAGRDNGNEGTEEGKGEVLQRGLPTTPPARSTSEDGPRSRFGLVGSFGGL